MNYYGYEFVRESDLQHYGLKGMHWGTRHWQNYDATNTFNEAGIMRYFGRKPGKDTESAKQPKVFHKTSKKAADDKHDNTDSNISEKELQEAKKATKLLAMSDEDAAKIAKIAKIAGISLATTAGVMAVGYIAYKYGPDIKSYLANPSAFRGVLERGYNDDPTAAKALKLGSQLFENAHNDDPIGAIAKGRGLGFVTPEHIANSIKNPIKHAWTDAELDRAVKDVTDNLRTYSSSRRLSCWSGSKAYFMELMTGEEYASRSFTNLVDFSDFDKLYTTTPEIFTINGNRISNFIGRWGKGYTRANTQMTKRMIRSIFTNISEANNLTPDGSRTAGFINAAYGGTTCNHEWNFELVHKANGLKELVMSDTWGGTRYSVANLTNSGQISYTSGLNTFLEEMHHYNARSIRFYAPNVNTVNPDMMANVILGKTGESINSINSDLASTIRELLNSVNISHSDLTSNDFQLDDPFALYYINLGKSNTSW